MIKPPEVTLGFDFFEVNLFHKCLHIGDNGKEKLIPLLQGPSDTKDLHSSKWLNESRKPESLLAPDLIAFTIQVPQYMDYCHNSGRYQLGIHSFCFSREAYHLEYFLFLFLFFSIFVVLMDFVVFMDYSLHLSFRNSGVFFENSYELFLYYF